MLYLLDYVGDRARVVRLAQDGLTNLEIARQVARSKHFIAKWARRGRLNQNHVDDNDRSGAKNKITNRMARKIEREAKKCNLLGMSPRQLEKWFSEEHARGAVDIVPVHHTTIRRFLKNKRWHPFKQARNFRVFAYQRALRRRMARFILNLP